MNPSPTRALTRAAARGRHGVPSQRLVVSQLAKRNVLIV
jgi:hypothetical protein